MELQVILPTLPAVSCFSICGLAEDFASCWLWDHMGASWGPLIFLFWGSGLLLRYRHVNNLPS
jgi:hypothetical protein